MASSAGEKLVAEIAKALPVSEGMHAEWTEVEAALIDLARRQADDIELLERVLEVEGPTVSGSMGQPRLHPAVAELRLGRQALTRILSELRLPDQGPLKDLQRQKAARARWARGRKGPGDAAVG